MIARFAAAALLVALASPAARAGDDPEKAVTKMVKYIRYSKDADAVKLMDADAQSRILLDTEYDKADPKKRDEFSSMFVELFSLLAYPNLRKNLEHLETTLYEPAKITGDKGELTGTLVILHPLKKQEIKVKFDVKKTKDGWKVVDVTVLGTASPSMLTSVRDDQVKPLFAAKGMDGLLEAMRTRLADLKKK